MKERDIVGLEAKLDQLATVKDRQAGQIEGLRQSRQQLDEKSGQASNTIRHLTDELNKVKYTLDDVTRRQRQVTLGPLKFHVNLHHQLTFHLELHHQFRYHDLDLHYDLQQFSYLAL